MIGALMAQAGLTQIEAAALCGVHPRTVANWTHGKTRVPAAALETLTQAAIAAFAVESDADEVAPPSLDERIGFLTGIQREQISAVARAENDLARMRRELAETTQRLAALNAERGRNETKGNDMNAIETALYDYGFRQYGKNWHLKFVGSLSNSEDEVNRRGGVNHGADTVAILAGVIRDAELSLDGFEDDEIEADPKLRWLSDWLKDAQAAISPRAMWLKGE